MWISKAPATTGLAVGHRGNCSVQDQDAIFLLELKFKMSIIRGEMQGLKRPSHTET